jgi:hypothetical protein
MVKYKIVSKAIKKPDTVVQFSNDCLKNSLKMHKNPSTGP